MAHFIVQFLATALGALLAAYAGASFVNKHPETYRVNFGLACMLSEWFAIPFVLMAWYYNHVAGFALLTLWTAVSASLARHWVNLKVRDNGTCSLGDLASGCNLTLGIFCVSEAWYWGDRLFVDPANGPISEIGLLWLFFMPLAFVIAQAVGWSASRAKRVTA